MTQEQKEAILLLEKEHILNAHLTNEEYFLLLGFVFGQVERDFQPIVYSESDKQF